MRFLVIGRSSIAALLVAVALCRCGDPTEVRRIGIVNTTPRLAAASEALKSELAELAARRDWRVAFVEIDPEPDPEALRRQTTRLIEEQGVEVLVAVSTTAAQIAVEEARGRKVPVVFLMVSDPVSAGIVSDLVSAAGNVTGVMDSGASLAGKRLEYLLRAGTNIRRVLVPHSASEPSTAILESLRDDARKLDVELVLLPIDSTGSISAVYATIEPNSVDAVYIPSDAAIGGAEEPLRDLVARLGIPSIVGGRDSAGAIFGFGTAPADVGKSGAWLVSKILDGIPASDLPVLSPPRPVMRVYAGNARRYGFSVAESAFWLADEIVE